MRLPDGGLAVTRAQVISASAECALATAKEFRDAAGTMSTSLTGLAAAPDAASLAAARAAFHLAFDSWQTNEGLQFGPAAPSTTPGGADLRDQIDSWPLFSRCAVEESLVAKSYESGVRQLLVNRRGMPALEYLLFYEGDMTACTATSPIVAQGTWAALSAAERTSRRYAYAAAVGGDIKAWADELVRAWESGFLQSITTAGSGSDVFLTTQSALNAVSDALFYVDASIMNKKLAPPIGLRECVTAPCLDLLESQHAGRSKRNIESNMVGFDRLMRGCAADGIGFDDLLIGVGADATAQALIARSDAVGVSLAAIEEADLKEALVADPASVTAVFDAARALASLMKTELLTVLDLELPRILEGDND